MIEYNTQCTACGACQNICPVDAIYMKPDEYGFDYPEIDSKKCINCDLCSKVCNNFNALKVGYPIEAYAAQTGITDIKKSASGGVFSALAFSVLKNGGVVCGCALVDMMPKHIIIHDEKELYKLQGSKYVQSEIGYIYRDIKKYLDDDTQVLFSGTPCQVDGLRKYLKKDYCNLILIDLICHGVPNADMFGGYLKMLSQKKTISDFRFRDKSCGWGLMGKAAFEKNGKEFSMPVYPGESSYYSAFLSGDIYRESCYSCKYANITRVGDLTIGDYWGIEEQHPELLIQNAGAVDERKGVSCILVNNKKGQEILKKYSLALKLYQSSADKVAKMNKQLCSPSPRGQNREQILCEYKCGGYGAVEKAYKKRRGIRLYMHIIKNRLKYISLKIKKK